MAETSATLPVADCTSENETSQVSSLIESASASSGTLRVRMFCRIWKGKTIDEKSPSTQRISAPSGAAAATRLAITELCDPMATRSSVTPTSLA